MIKSIKNTLVTPLFRLCVVLVVCIHLTACGLSQNATLALPDLDIGIAPIIQPMRNIELLAGYLPEPRALAYEDELANMQNLLEESLHATKRKVRFLDAIDQDIIIDRIDRNSRRGMLDYWLEYGKYNNVDLLIVPYLYYYNDKDAINPIGTTNALMLNFFLIDTRDEGLLLQRVHFAEEEQATSGDLRGMISFTKRIGDPEIQSMIKDAYVEMIQEFSLNN